MRRVALVLPMLFLAACSTTDWNDMRSNPREYFNLVSPTLQTDARVDGQRVTLHRWQALVVHLPEDPDSGERWEMQPIASSSVIAPVQHDLVARPGTDPTTQSGAGEAVFRVRGVAAGTQPVVLEYKRPFESAASKTIRFDVVVR
jgi:predicted secreted protein